MGYFLNVSNEAMRGDDTRPVRGQVLRLLRDAGPLSRIDVARSCGVSATTVTRVVGELLGEGLLVEGATIASDRPGRPATELSIARDACAVTAVHVGVGTLSFALIDPLGASRAIATDTYDPALPPRDVLDIIARHVDSLAAQAHHEGASVLGAGLAAPSPVDAAGRRLLRPINLPTWHDVPVADILEERTGLATAVEHNVRAMAMAEARFGAARKTESVVFVYAQTGLGAGLVTRGQPFPAGIHGAIEIGHLHAADNARACPCGNTGCLETIVSEPAFLRAAAETGVALDGTNPLVALHEAAAENPAARHAIDTIVTALARALAAVVNLLNPEVILLGGLLLDTPPPLLARLTRAARDLAFPVASERIDIRPADLGAHAGLIGAGSAALDRFLYDGRVPAAGHRTRRLLTPA
jgi:predicted NBD/HSP70 family sugar kinase